MWILLSASLEDCIQSEIFKSHQQFYVSYTITKFRSAFEFNVLLVLYLLLSFAYNLGKVSPDCMYIGLFMRVFASWTLYWILCIFAKVI